MNPTHHPVVQGDDHIACHARHAFVDNLDLGVLDTGFATVGSDGRITWVNHAFVEMTKGPAIFWTGRTMPSFTLALAQLGEHDTPAGRRVAAAKALAAEAHRWQVWRVLSPDRRWVFQRACERLPDGSMLLSFSDVTHQHAAGVDQAVTVSQPWRHRASRRSALHAARLAAHHAEPRAQGVVA